MVGPSARGGDAAAADRDRATRTGVDCGLGSSEEGGGRCGYEPSKGMEAPAGQREGRRLLVGAERAAAAAERGRTRGATSGSHTCKTERSTCGLGHCPARG